VARLGLSTASYFYSLLFDLAPGLGGPTELTSSSCELLLWLRARYLEFIFDKVSVRNIKSKLHHGDQGNLCFFL